jgi:hypothetical protein
MRLCHLNQEKRHDTDVRRAREMVMPQRRLIGCLHRPCVFYGPSMSGHEQPRGVDVYPPATRGALLEAVAAGYSTLGFIDGALDDADRVPLSELRAVLGKPGVSLVGGASLGAVRSVQLESAGMRGTGRIFRLFRRGALSDSDEVYVLHAPAALRYRPLTLPLVNIRYTLRRMRRAGHITIADEDALLVYLRDVPWFDRDRQSLSAAVYRTCASAHRAQVVQWFDRMYRDVKQEDAMAVVSAVLKHGSFTHRNDRFQVVEEQQRSDARSLSRNVARSLQ